MKNIETIKLAISDFLTENGVPCRQSIQSGDMLGKIGVYLKLDYFKFSELINKASSAKRKFALCHIHEVLAENGDIKRVDFYCKLSAPRKRVSKNKKKKPSKRFTFSDNRWKELRYRVLRASNGSCCLCGRTAKDGIKLHVDHIKPKSIYPELEYEFSNLQVLCEDCNIGKSNKDDTDWR